MFKRFKQKLNFFITDDPNSEVDDNDKLELTMSSNKKSATPIHDDVVKYLICHRRQV